MGVAGQGLVDGDLDQGMEMGVGLGWGAEALVVADSGLVGVVGVGLVDVGLEGVVGGSAVADLGDQLEVSVAPGLVMVVAETTVAQE